MVYTPSVPKKTETNFQRNLKTIFEIFLVLMLKGTHTVFHYFFLQRYSKYTSVIIDFIMKPVALHVIPGVLCQFINV